MTTDSKLVSKSIRGIRFVGSPLQLNAHQNDAIESFDHINSGFELLFTVSLHQKETTACQGPVLYTGEMLAITRA